MTIPLPNLDDRRWLDLVEEARALIPLYEPDWTDHNLSDPGITIIELLAWIAEMDIYWLNRIPESLRFKFLALAGYHPRGPRPSRATLRLELPPGQAALELPASLQFSAPSAEGGEILFTTRSAITVVPGRLESLLLQQGQTWTDLQQSLNRREETHLFGSDPNPSAWLYLGFSEPLPSNVPVTLHFELGGYDAGLDEAIRIHEDAEERAEFCPPALPECPPGGNQHEADRAPEPLVHHSVVITWEYFSEQGRWESLPATQVVDGTRGLTLSGPVTLTLPGPMGLTHARASSPRLAYLRAKLARGAFDAAPVLLGAALNGILVEQSTSQQTCMLELAPRAFITGTPPPPGSPVSFRPAFDAVGKLTALEFLPSGPPSFILLDFQPPRAILPGHITIAAEALRVGNGMPGQICEVDWPQVAGSPRLLSWEGDHWVEWQPVADFLSSGRADAHFCVHPVTGAIELGDGELGRVLPKGAHLFAAYESTLADDVSLPAGAITALAQTPMNRALLRDRLAEARRIIVSNPFQAQGGAPAETLAVLQARALKDLTHAHRAVTLSDIRLIALETPGAGVARVDVLPALHPAYPCYHAPGVITVVIVPFLPIDRPKPSEGLRQRVQSYLDARRVVGTRMIVTGPSYRKVSVKAEIHVRPGYHPEWVKSAIESALRAFFHPLTGGQDGTGWPVGRSIYRSEVLQIIDEVPGIDYVHALELIDADGEASCGNLCLRPLELVAAQPMQIEVFP